jgi:hypothetical protein
MRPQTMGATNLGGLVQPTSYQPKKHTASVPSDRNCAGSPRVYQPTPSLICFQPGKVRPWRTGWVKHHRDGIRINAVMSIFGSGSSKDVRRDACQILSAHRKARTEPITLASRGNRAVAAKFRCSTAESRRRQLGASGAHMMPETATGIKVSHSNAWPAKLNETENANDTIVRQCTGAQWSVTAWRDSTNLMESTAKPEIHGKGRKCREMGSANLGSEAIMDTQRLTWQHLGRPVNPQLTGACGDVAGSIPAASQNSSSSSTENADEQRAPAIGAEGRATLVRRDGCCRNAREIPQFKTPARPN